MLVHGSTGSGWMRRAAAGRPACLTVTDLTGIIVARSAFENSLRYRSAVLFGTFTRLAGPDVPRALGDPLPAPDLRPGIPVPASVRTMTGRHQWAAGQGPGAA